ncbi:MAG: hypothetical protein BroJett040_07590 [Oligoflexia bacterium]|nr:MAG: hypothetical protein BroJett040_07590 [Oligoflexia bacterium]
MKNIIAALIVLFLVEASHAEDLFTCFLNNGETLGISRSASENGGNTIQLEKIFLNDNRPRISTAFNQAVIVEYGAKFIILCNRGRSGYALINIDTEEESGIIDINLFGAQVNGLNMKDQKFHCLRGKIVL